MLCQIDKNADYFLVKAGEISVNLKLYIFVTKLGVF